MAVTDILVLATIVLSMVFGGWRGLVKEALSLAFWIAAVVLAAMFNERLAPMLDIISNPAVQRVAAFVLIFVATVFLGGLLGNLVSKLTSAAGLRATDRGLGALFGILRGLVIVTLVVVLTAPFEFSRPWYGDSVSVPYLLALAEYIQGWLGLDGSGTATTGT